jgi:choline dehydrogenase-like flavoprotein
MMDDARQVDGGAVLDADVCIIGAGVAGISIANELNGSSATVLLLESGGRRYDSETQMLYRGSNVGRAYYSLDTSRLRMFGGTSNHWGGNCRELSELDFEERDWVPHSGWPFPKADLADYYQRAARYLQLDDSDPSESQWAKESNFQISTSSMLQKRITQFSPKTPGQQKFRALSFGDAYHERLKQSRNITVLLYANVVSMHPNHERTRIANVKVATFTNSSFSVRARHFVLAAGGIENPRILLASGERVDSENGIGNDNDLVGRFFMEHVGADVGEFTPSNRDLSRMDIFETPEKRLDKRARELTRSKAYFLLNRETQIDERILSTASVMSRFDLPRSHSSDAYLSLKAVVGDVRHRVLPTKLFQHMQNIATGFDDLGQSLRFKFSSKTSALPVYRVHVQSEQAPNPLSRVKLGSDQDHFGKPRAVLDWQLSELDLRSIRVSTMRMAREIGRLGVGRMKINLPENDADLRKAIDGHWHHMGTTRMSDDPKLGVVDRNSKVHGIDNLFVAGSSVFPTGGHSVPTYTITALAVRLSDHIKGQLSQPS